MICNYSNFKSDYSKMLDLMEEKKRIALVFGKNNRVYKYLVEWINAIRRVYLIPLIS